MISSFLSFLSSANEWRSGGISDQGHRLGLAQKTRNLPDVPLMQQNQKSQWLSNYRNEGEWRYTIGDRPNGHRIQK
ncbi:hypothetical protein [Xenorhabdus vietnamensis]|uniref:hypothetical protein n=1 Tax=Xenorhabdus vietnamensis TaxID=351656 RepID=UPI00142E2C7F|nr:hypothetical protein [Xenorhabdus vietnamensis]